MYMGDEIIEMRSKILKRMNKRGKDNALVETFNLNKKNVKELRWGLLHPDFETEDNFVWAALYAQGRRIDDGMIYDDLNEEKCVVSRIGKEMLFATQLVTDNPRIKTIVAIIGQDEGQVKNEEEEEEEQKTNSYLLNKRFLGKIKWTPSIQEMRWNGVTFSGFSQSFKKSNSSDKKIYVGLNDEYNTNEMNDARYVWNKNNCLNYKLSVETEDIHSKRIAQIIGFYPGNSKDKKIAQMSSIDALNFKENK
eukprot:390445_1